MRAISFNFYALKKDSIGMQNGPSVDGRLVRDHIGHIDAKVIQDDDDAKGS